MTDKEYHRQYYLKHREEFIQKQKKRWSKIKDDPARRKKTADHAREYYRKNINRKRQYDRTYHYENETNRNKKNERLRKYFKKQSEQLTDTYIKGLIRQRNPKLKITSTLIEQKRTLLKLKRKIHETERRINSSGNS